ncbi:hypothetical protein IWQ60_003412 [Tieghemiomyces parasiticus]|uniref:RGS domain-containing protein n=1 Tax=Tieghemiomyces parasiticus TaxID=78921 RepID=A0A9W8AG82_9FUNG|nr:hypothetical protein IWQ60_003412 [Tieghemiomyces parasiticus]
MPTVDNQRRLDRILQGMTCPPVSLAEFRYYLTYQECSVENLNFYEWYRRYSRVFHNLSDADKALSPRSLGAFSTLTATPELIAAQPLRADCEAAIARFLAPGAQEELNVSHQVRSSIQAQANLTTHPSIFTPLLTEVMGLMRNTSLDGFHRWAQRNITDRSKWLRVTAATITAVLAVVTIVLLIVFDVPRPYRLLLFLPLTWAISVFYSNPRNVCLVHLFANRREVTMLPHARLSDLSIGDVAGGIGRDSVFAGTTTNHHQPQVATPTTASLLQEPKATDLIAATVSDDDHRNPPRVDTRHRPLSTIITMPTPSEAYPLTPRYPNAAVPPPASLRKELGPTAHKTLVEAKEMEDDDKEEDIPPYCNVATDFTSPLFQTTTVRGDAYYKVMEPAVLKAHYRMAAKMIIQIVLTTAAVWVAIMFIPNREL